MFYFAYGSNLDIEKMKIRCPDSEVLGIAILRDYEICFPIQSQMWKGGVASIRAHQGALVQGLVYKVSESDILALDLYEEFIEPGHRDNLYEKIEIAVVLTGGDSLKVFAYQVQKHQDLHYAPSEEYMQILRDFSKKF